MAPDSSDLAAVGFSRATFVSSASVQASWEIYPHGLDYLVARLVRKFRIGNVLQDLIWFLARGGHARGLPEAGDGVEREDQGSIALMLHRLHTQGIVVELGRVDQRFRGRSLLENLADERAVRRDPGAVDAQTLGGTPDVVGDILGDVLPLEDRAKLVVLAVARAV